MVKNAQKLIVHTFIMKKIKDSLYLNGLKYFQKQGLLFPSNYYMPYLRNLNTE